MHIDMESAYENQRLLSLIIGAAEKQATSRRSKGAGITCSETSQEGPRKEWWLVIALGVLITSGILLRWAQYAIITSNNRTRQ